MAGLGLPALKTLFGSPTALAQSDPTEVGRWYKQVLSAFRATRQLAFDRAREYATHFPRPSLPTYVNVFGIEYPHERRAGVAIRDDNVQVWASYLREFEVRFPHWGLAVQHIEPGEINCWWMPVSRELPRLSELVPELASEVGAESFHQFEAEHTPYVCPFEWLTDWPAWELTTDDYRRLGACLSHRQEADLGAFERYSWGHPPVPVREAIPAERLLQRYHNRQCRLSSGAVVPVSSLLPDRLPTDEKAHVYMSGYPDGRVEVFPLVVTETDCWLPGEEQIGTILPDERERWR